MIFYFTGSGNSYTIAKKISSNLNEKMTSIGNVIKIYKYLNEQNYEYKIGKNEYIGFVFPTHCFGVPKTVIEFIKNLKLENYKDQYVFSIITCGSNSGNTAYELLKILSNKSIFLNSIFSLNMPRNCILLYDPQKIQKQREIIESSFLKLKKINTIIKNKENKYHTKYENKTLMYQIANKILTILFNKIYNSNKYHVLENCIHCGLCVTKCPLNILSLEETTKKPIWKDNNECMFCLACINNCPVKAIQYNNITIKRKRYTILKTYY